MPRCPWRALMLNMCLIIRLYRSNGRMVLYGDAVSLQYLYFHVCSACRLFLSGTISRESVLHISSRYFLPGAFQSASTRFHTVMARVGRTGRTLPQALLLHDFPSCLCVRSVCCMCVSVDEDSDACARLRCCMWSAVALWWYDGAFHRWHH